MSGSNSGNSGIDHDVVIIGAGFAGLAMAIALRKAGMTDFVIVEQAAELGGVWRDNSYPGAACDVPSHLYSFSFEPNPRWSRVFAPQAEILEYMRHCARKYQLTPHLRLGCGVASAVFDEAAARWRVTLTDGRTIDCRILVSGVGQLSRPALPRLPGLESFVGPSFHSARWDHGLDLRGKRVAVIGTGASALQFVPEVAKQAAQLDIYQRSPAWLMARGDRAYSAAERWAFAHVPGALPLRRAWIYVKYESRALAFTRFRSLMTPVVGWPFMRMLKRDIPDAALRQDLTPDYQIGCKRILLSDDYLKALARPNVTLRTAGIERIAPEGIVGRDGRLQPADVIVYGTGFAATEFLAPMRIQGRGGQDLNQAWRGGAAAYLGITVPGFPNFFMLYGPNTNLGHNSIIFMIESQVAHVMRCLNRLGQMQAGGSATVEPGARRFDRYQQEIQRHMRHTVWQGCSSWYVDANGHNSTNWPGYTFSYRLRTRHSSLAAYRFERALDEPGAVMVEPPAGLAEAALAALLRGFLRLAFRAFIGPPFGVRAQRFVVALLTPLMIARGGTRQAEHRSGEVAVRRVVPTGGAGASHVLYLHGGAFCLGSPATHRAITARLAVDAAATVHVPDYRLAPEHPYPAALDDALACYEQLLATGVRPEHLVVAGDSAGGALALALLLTLRERGRPLPAATALISPVTDATLGGDTLDSRRAADPMIRAGWLRQALAWYAAPPRATAHRPLQVDLAGLPPMLVQVGDDEILRADATRLAAHARRCGVPCRLEVHRGRWHVFHLQAFFLRSGRQAIAGIAAFVRQHTAGAIPARPGAARHEAARVGVEA